MQANCRQILGLKSCPQPPADQEFGGRNVQVEARSPVLFQSPAGKHGGHIES